MTPGRDFERAWLAKLARSITDAAGEGVRDEVMAGSEDLASDSAGRQIIAWTSGV